MSALIPQRRKNITELYRVQAHSIDANTLGTIRDIVPLTYPFITITVRADVSHAFDVMVQFNPNTGTPALSSTPPPMTITEDVVSDGLRLQTSWIEARSDRVNVYVKNNDTVTHTYSVLIYGIA